MIIPYNSAHGVFRRKGMTQYNGEPMHEIIVLEADGSVSSETPIMFSYAQIDSMDVYRLDPSTAITVKNGVFTTLESRVNHYLTQEDGTLLYIYHGYIWRDIHVLRSYTTVENIEHRVTGGFTLLERAEQNLEGAMCHGFLVADNANHVTFKNCTIPGRTSPGPGNGHSSYGFKANHVNKIVLDGCVQPNFWVTIDPVTYEIKNATERDESKTGYSARTATKNVFPGMGSVEVNGINRRLCWGFGGTNYCKNVEYINSTVTRFDAHAGLYNGKIINSRVSYLALTGYGDMIVENSSWYQSDNTNAIASLRGDYGYHWRGNIILKNVNAYMNNRELAYVTGHGYINWYFGYTCTIPNFTIDNLRFFNQQTEEPLGSDFKVKFVRFKENAKRMHLDDSGVPSVFPVNDYDGDGYIDEPRFISDEDGTFYPACDLDGDGRVGNTSLKYDEYMNAPDFITGGVARPSYFRGATHPTCTANLNKVRPPKYIKVLNNTDENGNAVYKYYVKDTSGEGISDGGWYRAANEPDTMGGFFGGTKFFYGDGDYVIGTADNAAAGESFVFVKEYDE